MLDATGHVVSWNPGARRFKGYDAHEIVGQHFSRFYTDDDRARGVPVVLLLAGGYAPTPEATADLHAEVHRQARALGMGA